MLLMIDYVILEEIGICYMHTGKYSSIYLLSFLLNQEHLRNAVYYSTITFYVQGCKSFYNPNILLGYYEHFPSV